MYWIVLEMYWHKKIKNVRRIIVNIVIKYLNLDKINGIMKKYVKQRLRR
jgi:hypothetical protein